MTDQDQCDKYASIFWQAYENNDLEKMKWVVGLGYKFDTSRAFLLSCINGNFEMVKFLYLNLTVIDMLNYCAFIYTCQSGHLEIAQWINSVYRMDQMSVNEVFIVACRHNQLHVAKWLHSIGVDMTSPRALIGICSMGHIEIVQWMHSQNFDISSRTAFIQACENDNIDIVEFLIEKCHKYNGYITFNGVIDFSSRINKLLMDSNVVHPEQLSRQDLKYYLEINNNCVPDDYICPFPEFTTNVRGKHTKSAR